MQKYSLPLRIFHWLIALLTITLLCVGFYMAGLPNTDINKPTLYTYHKSFGIILLLFVIARVITRLFSSIPAFPKQISRLEQYLAKAGHYILYAFLIVMPVSGLLMSMLGGRGVNFFGLYQLPNPFVTDKAMSSIFYATHVYLPWFFVAMIAIHIIAVPYHYFKQKINILRRIV